MKDVLYLVCRFGPALESYIMMHLVFLSFYRISEYVHQDRWNFPRPTSENMKRVMSKIASLAS
ncbi:hypothetical protein LguiB_005550 [Lonicera macranthoides]